MKFLKTATAFFRSLGRPYPLRDWYIVLGVTLATVAWTVFVATYFFFGIRSGSIISPSAADNVPTPSVSRDALKEVVAEYETRLLNYESGNIPTPETPDPSR